MDGHNTAKRCAPLWRPAKPHGALHGSSSLRDGVLRPLLRHAGRHRRYDGLWQRAFRSPSACMHAIWSRGGGGGTVNERRQEDETLQCRRAAGLQRNGTSVKVG